jgi:thiamine pyrophosphokinase
MDKYVFKDNKFDVAICLNGEIPDKEIFDKIDDLPLIAADGAFNKLFSMGVQPMAIVGDMDSIERQHNALATQYVKIADEETNDFEKCMRFIEGKGYKSVLILGFTGGLLEHALNNTSIIIKFAAQYDFTIYHHNRYAFFVDKPSSFAVSVRETVSIIPYPRVVLSTKNLEWSLKNEALELGVREGARNRTTAPQFELDISSGRCFVFIDSRLPLCPHHIG